ncbi:MAG: hypothetical protein ACOY5B_02405 [Spirochaetota bacterium]
MLSTKWVLYPALAVIFCAAALQAQGTPPAAEKAVKAPVGRNDAAPVEKANTTDNELPAETESDTEEAVAEPAESAVKPVEPAPATTEPVVPPVTDPPVAEKKAEPRPEQPAPVANEFRLMTGIHGGLVIPFNSIHSVGYNFGMTLDYTLYRRYGIHFGAETGVLPARAQTLAASPANIAVLDGGTFGFLNLRLTGMYVFPKIWDLNPSAGFGLAYYQLSGGTYDFKASIAPVAVASLYYDILPNLQLGVIGQFLLATTGKITTTGAEYTLKSSTWLTTASLAVSLRYAWF